MRPTRNPARHGLSALLSVLLVFTSITSAYAGEDDRDAATYATAFDVSVEEAARRLGMQPMIGVLERRLEARESATFAGLWIEHRPFHVYAAFTEAGASTLARYVRGGALEGSVSAVTARRTLETLRAELSRLAVGSDRPFDAGINVADNRIDIETTSEKALHDWAAENDVQLPNDARIRIVSSLPSPTADIYGGLSLTTCTSGFGVRHAGGALGISTAGHCQNSQSYNGTNLPFVVENFGGWYDVQWHTTPGFTVRNLIYIGGSTRSITSRTFWGSQTVGATVCKYGRNTGYACGTISRKDDIPACIPNARPVWVRSNSLSGAGGDSGGPVFLNNSAYGTISCADSNALIYDPIDFVESGVNVTVLTN